MGTHQGIVRPIIVFSLFGLAACSSNTSPPSESPSQSYLPACGSTGPVLTHFPVDLNKVAYITPLGTMNPPGWHTLPTDHSYIISKLYQNPSSPTEALANTLEIYAPADGWITDVRRGEASCATGTCNDFAVTFATCEEVRFRFGHVITLSSKLSKGNECPKDTYCEIGIAVTAGELIGTAYKGGSGTGVAGVDFGSKDERVITSNQALMVNPSRYTELPFFNVSCPYDYFSQSIRDELYDTNKTRGQALLGTDTALPIFGGSYSPNHSVWPNAITWNGISNCGTIFSDVANTLQGYWFGSASGPLNIDATLVLAPDPYNAAQQAISWSAEPHRMAFTPTSSGLVNRNFSQVTYNSSGTNEIYCYDSGYLIQMLSATSLRFEKHSGSCADVNLTFSSPLTYYR